MKKTTLQKLITHLEMQKSKSDMVDVNSIIEYANNLLENEKKDIVKAVNANEKYCVEYCNGIFEVFNPSAGKLCTIDKKAGINYYNKTYK
jgi:hypothetical protein